VLAHRLVGELERKAPSRQQRQRPLALGLGRHGCASRVQERPRPRELSAGALVGERSLDPVFADPARPQRLGDPRRPPPRQLALVLGVAAGEAVVVEDLGLDQARERLGDLFLAEAALA
jgi:hypothetical protein